MSYKPGANEVDLELTLSRKIDEILSNVKQVGSMYVEPGDLILVRVNDEADDYTLGSIRKVLSSVFKENPGFFMTNDIDVQVLRRSEQFKEEMSSREKLTNAIQGLEARIAALENKLLVQNEKL